MLSLLAQPVSWPEILDVLGQVRSICPVVSVSLSTHDRAVVVAERYGLSIDDALIVAAALLGGCKIRYSEDMQHGQVIE